MNIFKSKSGFTLIELLVVIGILAVLAAIAIPSVAGLIDRANVSADKTNANEMTNAMERFAAEYELYCQDIASGVIKADTTDFDAAQGRVYNVTGALSRSDIETLEVAQGATVADDQIAIYRDTKYPVNAMTAKSIVMNYTKTSSSTFEPKQSDMHFWYSPDCGVVVFAEPNADVVTQLNVQILSGKDAKGNELGASTKWIDLTADTTPVATHAMLNKTDVLTGHNEAYFRSAADFDNFVAVKVDGNVVDGSSYTLSEGSTVVVLKPEFVQTLSEGEHTMEIQSTDGSAVCDFTVTAPANHGLHFNETYSATVDGMLAELIFREDKSVEFYVDNAHETTIPGDYVEITNDTVDLSAAGYGVGTISSDGKTLSIAGITFVLQEKLTQISTPFYVEINLETGKIAFSKERPKTNNVFYITDDYMFAYQSRDRYPDVITGWECSSLMTKEGAQELSEDCGVKIVGNFKSANSITKCPTIPAYINGEPVKIINALGYNGIEKRFTETPTIPSTVVYLYETFSGWTALEEVGYIPDTVLYQHALFRDCTSLKKIPQLPSQLTDLDGMFQGCTGLTGTLELNLPNATSGFQCFDRVDFVAQNITLTGNCDILDELGATGTNYCANCDGKCNGNH